MREVHGVIARKVKVSQLCDVSVAVRVSDGEASILLVLATDINNPAGLTPEEARFLAKQLVDAAKRFEQRENK